MKNILKIHFGFYALFIIFFLIGKFKTFIFFSSIIMFHEIGHIVIGLFFKYKIEKIVILPMGSLTIFNKKINTSFYEEFLLTIMGPVFQMILMLFIKDEVYFKYNLYLLIFNLLPIYPLDGYKLLKICLYKFFSFKAVNIYSLYLSILVLISFFVLRPTSILIYVVVFVYLIQIISEIKNNKFIFNKFLFERYLYNIKYKNDLLIKGNNLDKMHIDKSHTFIIGNKLIEEQKMLGKMFDKP